MGIDYKHNGRWEEGKVAKNSNCSEWPVSLFLGDDASQHQGNDATEAPAFLVSCYAGLRSLPPPPTVSLLLAIATVAVGIVVDTVLPAAATRYAIRQRKQEEGPILVFYRSFPPVLFHWQKRPKVSLWEYLGNAVFGIPAPLLYISKHKVGNQNHTKLKW